MCNLSHYNLASVAKVLDVPLLGSDDVFSAVSIDTRTLMPGELFIALVGPNFDGHEHLETAMNNGAVAAIVSKVNESIALTQIQVQDTRLALADLASARRSAFAGRVIGLTGSNGKTTVKELIATVLKRKGKVLATAGNFNNNIGLPLTLLSLQNDEMFAVIEMGANHFGEIDFLSHITKPDIALITNAGAAHLEGFGDVKGVSRAKAEIFSGLASGGTAIINADDEYASYWQEKTANFRQVRFGIDAENAEIKAKNLTLKSHYSEFELVTPLDTISIRLPVGGKHNVMNVLAATAVAYVERVDLPDVKRAVETFEPVKGRLNFHRGQHNAVIIDDTYNANFDSTLAAINVLSSQEGRKMLILGDMLESGGEANQLHADIGRIAKQKGIDELLAFGDLSQSALATFGSKAKGFSNKEKLIEYAQEQLGETKAVLIKGSRGMEMEKVVKRLIQGAA